jgi:hypothetical protein
MDNKINICGGKLAGNTFHGTKEQVMLAKHGWRCVERQKNGCVWIVRWYDPLQGGVWNQGTSVVIQRGRNKHNKQIKEKGICYMM